MMRICASSGTTQCYPGLISRLLWSNWSWKWVTLSKTPLKCNFTKFVCKLLCHPVKLRHQCCLDNKKSLKPYYLYCGFGHFQPNNIVKAHLKWAINCFDHLPLPLNSQFSHLRVLLLSMRQLPLPASWFTQHGSDVGQIPNGSMHLKTKIILAIKNVKLQKIVKK